MSLIKNTEQLKTLVEKLSRQRERRSRSLAVCGGTGCKAGGSFELFEAFREELRKKKLDEKVELRLSGCHGFCERGPLVLVQPEGVFYQRVQPSDVAEIIEKTVQENQPVERLLYQRPEGGERVLHEAEIPFYKYQKRLVLDQNGLLDPNSIEDYLSLGGYLALARALEMTPEKIIEEIEASGLRGRGGAGFPTGKKWRICRDVPGADKIIICNADEGDPGAFMDRSVLEGNPHRVIEGMLIGARAIGARRGYVYVRQEYPLAVERLERAIAEAKERGLLGENILGGDLSFELFIRRGGGAFVCGEETALIASIEGRRGVPRRRPPYPAQKGLFGLPTCINNVETWANVPLIIKNGSGWFASIGTAGSKGTKIFSLVGKVNHTGLVEVPMGISLRQIIFDIGGGIPGGRRFKAVQTGGPSGGCLPEGKLDLPVDFDTLLAEGAMMGSGGMIVMDETTCMVDVARYFTGFLKFESCGNCTSCRDGLIQLHRLLDDITQGRAQPGVLDLLEELARTIRDTSLCALGKTAVNPVLSTLRHFREEYLEHIERKRCPAGVCKALIRYRILEDKCNGCTLCAKNCPQNAIRGEKKKLHIIEQDKCIKCGICRDVCNQQAVLVE